MFPLNSNQSYIKDTGERTTLGKVIGSGGGGGSDLPEYDETDAGKVLSVDNEGDLTWSEPSGTLDTTTDEYIVAEINDFEYYIPGVKKRYSGSGNYGYHIVTESTSSSTASIKIYDGTYDTTFSNISLLATLVHNGVNTYSDENIGVEYKNAAWTVTVKKTMYKTDGTTWSATTSWSYSTENDMIILTKDPTA